MKDGLNIFVLIWFVLTVISFSFWPEDLGQMYHERYNRFMIGWNKVQ